MLQCWQTCDIIKRRSTISAKLGVPIPSMFIEGLDTLFALPVPHSDRLVVTTGHNQSTIWTELCTPYPVAMPTQRKLKLLSIHCPHLEVYRNNTQITSLKCYNSRDDYVP